MADIVERLRGFADLFEAQQAPGNLVLHMRAGADEIERHKAEIASLLNALADTRTECMRLRAALKSVMVGGNSLAQIIGADHPPHGTPYSEALAHYGSGVKYEAWCCWSAIMQARAELEEGRT